MFELLWKEYHRRTQVGIEPTDLSSYVEFKFSFPISTCHLMVHQICYFFALHHMPFSDDAYHGSPWKPFSPVCTCTCRCRGGPPKTSHFLHVVWLCIKSVIFLTLHHMPFSDDADHHGSPLETIFSRVYPSLSRRTPQNVPFSTCRLIVHQICYFFNIASYAIFRRCGSSWTPLGNHFLPCVTRRCHCEPPKTLPSSASNLISGDDAWLCASELLKKSCVDKITEMKPHGITTICQWKFNFRAQETAGYCPDSLSFLPLVVAPFWLLHGPRLLPEKG